MSVPHPQQPHYYSNYAPPPQQPPAKRGIALAAVITAGVAFLLGWVPIFGAIAGLAGIALGIVALLKGQNKVMSIIAIAAGSVALITSVAVTAIIGALGNNPNIGAAPAQTSAPAAPVETSTEEIEPEPTVEETSTPTPEPEPTPTEQPGPDLASFQPLDERAYALLARDPDAHIGDQFILTGVVFQFDSATGQCSFLANTGHAQMENSYDYEQNAIFVSGDGFSDCPVLADVVEDDHVRLWVETLGSFSYDTQIGGNTTVPSFDVLKVEQLPRQEY